MNMTIIREPWDGKKSHRFLDYFTHEYFRLKSPDDVIPLGWYWVFDEEGTDNKILVPMLLFKYSPEFITYWTTPPDGKKDDWFKLRNKAITRVLERNGIKVSSECPRYCSYSIKMASEGMCKTHDPGYLILNSQRRLINYHSY